MQVPIKELLLPIYVIDRDLDDLRFWVFLFGVLQVLLDPGFG